MKELSFVLKQKILYILFVILYSILLIIMGDSIEMIKLGESLFLNNKDN